MILLVLLLIFPLFTLTLTHVYLLPDLMKLPVLLLISPTFVSHSVKSFGQAVDTHELEGESRVGKINSKTSKIIWSGSRYI
jgi:hypothetical protein